jgi:aminomethyltransferase
MARTGLHGWHKAHGANIVDFGGWDMPLWYPTGAVREHLAVIESVGLFDTSHMVVVTVEGLGAFDLLQRCFSRDLARWPGPGRCGYGVILNETGHVIDDAIVYPMGENRYVVVVNAGMGPVVKAHFVEHGNDLEVDVQDLTGRVGKIDLQGPQSVTVLRDIVKNASDVFSNLPYFAFKGHFAGPMTGDSVMLEDETPILLSRSGYTGELGFEIFMKVEKLVDVWERLIRKGSDRLIPCGLAARDSLRVGAVLPLSHQDIGAWPFVHNPWTFALPYAEDGRFSKDFIGAEALLKASAEYTKAFVGYDPRKVNTHDPAVVLTEDGREIGRVLTNVADMAIGRVEGKILSVVSEDKPAGFKPRGLTCGFVKINENLPDHSILEIKDNRRRLQVQITSDIRPARTARRRIT